MSYETHNELEHFTYDQAQVGNLQIASGIFHFVFDNVMILPENSCNRDIRTMRCNEMLFALENPEIVSVIEEGYRLLDANGNLKEEVPDRTIAEVDYSEVWEVLLGGEVYSLERTVKEQTGGEYLFVIDGTNERTYNILVKAQGDREEWERFLNVAEM